MEGRLLTIQRQCEKHDSPSDATATEIIRGPWILAPENDPNTLGTLLEDDKIPKHPAFILDHKPDPDHRMAEHLVLEFLTELLAKDRFRATEAWTAWALHALDFEKINGSGREWTESFKVVIVRQPIGETRLQ